MIKVESFFVAHAQEKKRNCSGEIFHFVFYTISDKLFEIDYPRKRNFSHPFCETIRS